MPRAGGGFPGMPAYDWREVSQGIGKHPPGNGAQGKSMVTQRPSQRSARLQPKKKTDRRSDLSSVETGSVLLSRAVSHRVSSALKSLTTVFGMGTGVTSSLLPPDSFALAIFADHFVTARSSLGHVSQYAPSLIPCVPCPPRTCLRAHSES